MENFNLNNYLNSHLVEFNTLSGKLKNTLDSVSNELLDFEKKQSDYYIIDRLEDNTIVCEIANSKEMVNISKNDVMGNVREGDCLIKKGNQFVVNKEMTSKRRDLIIGKFNNVKGK